VKYAWIHAQRHSHPIAELCRVLNVSLSGYQAHRRGGSPTRQRPGDGPALTLIRTIHAESRQAYGARRVYQELRSRGHSIGQRRVERLMREHGLRGRHKRRYKATTNSAHDHPIADNRLARQFTPSAPNQVWTADITYLWTDEGWLYLAVVLDLFNREVIGWSIQPRMTTDLVLNALTMATFRRKPTAGVMFHSDRGSQYASQTFRQRLAQAGMIQSMSRKGNCWDNALTESFFNSLKNERVHGSRYATRDAAKADVFQYIAVFYNRRRRHSALGYRSPTQFMQDWLAEQDAQQLAA